MQNREKTRFLKKFRRERKQFTCHGWLASNDIYRTNWIILTDNDRWQAIISRLALWRRAWPPLETLDFIINICSTPTFSVSFRFVSQHCLRSTLRLFYYLNVLMAEMPIKHVFGCFLVRNSPVALIVKLSFSKPREEKTNTFTKLSLIAEHANVSCKESTTRNKQFEDLE